jgi:hypothetical protein
MVAKVLPNFSPIGYASVILCKKNLGRIMSTNVVAQRRSRRIALLILNINAG